MSKRIGNQKERVPSQILFQLAIIAAMILWGGAWTSGKFISGAVNNNVIVFWRFLFAFLSFIPILIYNKISLAISLKSLLLTVLAAAFFTAYNQFFFSGLNKGLAGAGGVLVTTTVPFFTYIAAVIFNKYSLSKKSAAGLLLGLSGGCILLKIWEFDTGSLLHSGNLLFLGASVSWALLTVTSQKVQKNVEFFVYTFYLYGASALIQLFFALPYSVSAVFRQDAFFWFNLIYLSFFAMAFASTIYFLAARRLGSHRASSFVFVVPVSALFFSFILLGEKHQWYTIAGGATAIIAVYILNSKSNAKKPVKQPAD